MSRDLKLRVQGSVHIWSTKKIKRVIWEARGYFGREMTGVIVVMGMREDVNLRLNREF